MKLPQVLNEDEAGYQNWLNASQGNQKVIRHHECTERSVTTPFVNQAYGAGSKLILAIGDQSVSAE
jgi:hypothetical protein